MSICLCEMSIVSQIYTKTKGQFICYCLKCLKTSLSFWKKYSSHKGGKVHGKNSPIWNSVQNWHIHGYLFLHVYMASAEAAELALHFFLLLFFVSIKLPNLFLGCSYVCDISSCSCYNLISCCMLCTRTWLSWLFPFFASLMPSLFRCFGYVYKLANYVSCCFCVLWFSVHYKTTVSNNWFYNGRQKS